MTAAPEPEYIRERLSEISKEHEDVLSSEEHGHLHGAAWWLQRVGEGDTRRPRAGNCPVTLMMILQLIERHPAWRKATHTTPDGREVWMVEFADNGYEFAEGLPEAFVELVGNWEGDDGDDS